MGCQEWSLITACPRRAVVVCYTAGQTRDSSQGFFLSELVYLSSAALLLKIAILNLLLYNLVIRGIQAFSPRRLEVVPLSWQVLFFRYCSCTILFLSFESFCVMPFKKKAIYGLFLFYYISKQLNEIWCLYNSHWIFQNISFFIFFWSRTSEEVFKHRYVKITKVVLNTGEICDLHLSNACWFQYLSSSFNFFCDCSIEMKL